MLRKEHIRHRLFWWTTGDPFLVVQWHCAARTQKSLRASRLVERKNLKLQKIGCKLEEGAIKVNTLDNYCNIIASTIHNTRETLSPMSYVTFEQQ